jgi:hypothetical protein
MKFTLKVTFAPADGAAGVIMIAFLNLRSKAAKADKEDITREITIKDSFFISASLLEFLLRIKHYLFGFTGTNG